MVSLSNILKPFLFETSTLLGLIVLGLLALRVDSLLGLPVLPTWPYSYFGTVPVLGGIGLRFWASSTIFNTGKGTPLYTRPTKALVTTGPYRLIRNPLYLQGFLIYLGIIITIPSLFLAFWD
jgi:protein-S-isoprenylcysteine O-methyltransferase Ste14